MGVIDRNSQATILEDLEEPLRTTVEDDAPVVVAVVVLADEQVIRGFECVVLESVRLSALESEACAEEAVLGFELCIVCSNFLLEVVIEGVDCVLAHSDSIVIDGID